MVLALGCGDDSTNGDAGGTGPGTTTSESTGPGTTSGETMVGTSGSETAADTTADGTDSGDSTGVGTTAGTTEGDSTSDASTGGTTMGLGTTGGTDSEGTDTGVGLGGCYDPGDYPYAGTLCGPAANPCVVIADEAVDPTGHFRNGAPAIVLDDDCEPQVLYSVAEGGFIGHFARRTAADTWDDAQTPFPVARGGLGFAAATGETLAMPYDGAFGVEIWRWDGMWTLEDSLAGQQLLRSRSVTHDGNGTLHVGLVTNGSDLLHGQWDGAWATTNLDMQVNSAATALGPGGEANLGYWTSTNGTWEMRWAVPNQPTELVSALGSNLLSVIDHGIAVVPDGGAGTPHVVFATQSVAGGLHEVVYARRVGANNWTVVPVASESQATNTQCGPPPNVAGQQCNYDFIRMRPLDIVASDGGDVRIFYAQDHFMGTLQSVCMPGPGGGFCDWQSIATSDTSDFMIAWPTQGGGIADAVVMSDRRVQSMMSSVDIDGRIHIAAYAGFGSPVVDYLRIGESP